MKVRWLILVVFVLVALQMSLVSASGQSSTHTSASSGDQQGSMAVREENRGDHDPDRYLISQVFTGTVSQGNMSQEHQFSVSSYADYVLVTLAMKKNDDLDLSLYDNQNRRTGGWTSTEHYNRTNIPNSGYSGYSNYGHRIREWITVKPTTTSGIWKVKCFAYRGGGTYTIRVEIRGGYEEEGTKEVGIEWVNDYPGTDGDRQYRDDSAEDLVDNLEDEGWTERYCWEEGNVWERDYKSKLYVNGLEEAYTDAVDLAFFAGHGSVGSNWEDTDAGYMKYDAGAMKVNSDRDEKAVLPHVAYMSWGDQDLEWIGLDACHVLKHPWEWAQAMNGLHLICGFANRSYEDGFFGSWNNMGGEWSDGMIGGWLFDDALTIKQSWFDAADDVMDNQAWVTGKCITARVIGENNACGNDYLHGQGSHTSDPVHDNTYRSWDHPVGRCCPPIVYHPTGATSVMLYRVIKPTIDETRVTDIGAIFGITGDVHAESRHGVMHYYMKAGDATLVVSENGGIKYMDGSSLWKTMSTQPELPSVSETRAIAEDFLVSNDLMPADAVFLNVVEDTQTKAYSVLPQSRPPGEEPTEEDHIIEKIVTNYQVLFERAIDGFPVSSRLVVFIGEGGAIVGLKKNWKEVVPDFETGLIPEDEAWDLLRTYNSRFSVHGFPSEGPISKTASGLAYYNYPDGAIQEHLMPVYVFDVDVVEDSEVERIAVPAVYSFVGPIPVIMAPDDESRIACEVPMEFSGDCLYGEPPYTLKWRSSIDGNLGAGPEIVVPGLSPGRHTITLEVMDADGATKKDMVSVTVLEPSSVEEAEVEQESALTLLSPNPVLGPVGIEYSVAHDAHVQISVFDIQGREVALLVDGVVAAGRHRTTWDTTGSGKRLPAGFYLVRYQAADEVTSRRLILVR